MICVRFLSIFTCVITVLLVLSTRGLSLPISINNHLLNQSYRTQYKDLSSQELYSLARAITVKVEAGQGWGSGIIIQKQGQIYTVLTNAHVLRIGNSYKIKTADGKTHDAQIFTSTKFLDNDLALLSFQSNSNYTVAEIASSGLAVGDKTFAAGFPDDTKDFVFNSGIVDYIFPQPFQGGYQIGYSNDIFKGMSGGPLLNSRGELIAINGKHKNPLWGNSYIFKDGSTPPLEIRQRLENSSWAVPVKTFLQLAPQFSKSNILTGQISSRKNNIYESQIIAPASSKSEQIPNINSPLDNYTKQKSFW